MKFTSVYQPTVKKKSNLAKILPGMLAVLSLGAVIFIGTQSLGRKDTAPEQSSASEGNVVSFMSYNIMWSDQTDERLNEIADCIIAEEVDIVGFQEVNGFYSGTSGDRNTIEDLKLILTNKGKNFDTTGVVARTVGILSKYPVSDYLSGSLGNGGDVRGYQTGVVIFDDKDIRIVNAHPYHTPQCVQQNQLHEILSDDIFEQGDGTFVMGDFNMQLNVDDLSCNILFRENWLYGCDPYVNNECLDSVNDEVWHKYGGSGEAEYIIDNVMFNNESWIVKEAFVSTSEKCSTSDHFPVIVRFEYQEESVCTPSCEEQVCGDNGCGGSCGTCTGGKVCNATGQCVDSVIPSVSVSPQASVTQTLTGTQTASPETTGTQTESPTPKVSATVIPKVRKADYTGTGRVGMADFAKFKRCYIDRDVCSDLNEDGNYDRDINDWLVFIREYKEDNI